jgi:hypothetical protein
LSKQSGEEANVIVLVSDQDFEAVSGAKVVLLAEGNSYTQVTDTNGIAKFTDIVFADTLEAQLRVQIQDYQTNYQNITLQPDKTFMIRLDPTTNSFQTVDTFTK